MQFTQNLHFVFMKDYLSEQIVTLHIHVSFGLLMRFFFYQFADHSYIKQVSERLKVDKTIYKNIKPIHPKFQKNFDQFRVISKPPEEKGTAAYWHSEPACSDSHAPKCLYLSILVKLRRNGYLCGNLIGAQDF